MPVTLKEAEEIMQAVTIDVWNNDSKTERLKLMKKYCSPQMKAYAPDGSETVGYEEVCQITDIHNVTTDHSSNSAIPIMTSCTPMIGKTGNSMRRVTCG